MILANNISDLYNINAFLPKNLSLNIVDYKKIYDCRNIPLRFTPLPLKYIYFLPDKSFPQKLLSAAFSLKHLIRSDEFLSVTVSDKEVLKKWRKLTNEPIPTLFELIVYYKKIPIKNLDSRTSSNIMNDVDNCFKLQVLKRFFNNNGRVFYSELLNNMVTYLGCGGHAGLPIERARDYYRDLIQDGILKQATEEDLHIVLKYKTKEELITALDKLGIENINIIRDKNKTEIIEKLAQKNETKSIKLQEHFCFLNSDLQELKEWIVKEIPYYSLWQFFKDFKISEAYYCFEGLMKHLVSANKDYVTAIKLGKLFFQLKEYYHEVGGNRIGQETLNVSKLLDRYEKKVNKDINKKEF